MARSLAERLRAHEQQKARLAEQEAKLKDDERKARTRRLIQGGGLIDKAGLLDHPRLRQRLGAARHRLRRRRTDLRGQGGIGRMERARRRRRHRA